ncbi:MAG TPA: hypothetical protein DFS52_31700 [Myxococcales bacterium]|nr:hypothetical protein [Myxococcales bacterium]
MDDPFQLAPPPINKLHHVREVSEVFSDSEYTIRVVLAELKDRTYALWSERKATDELCTGTVIYQDETTARAAYDQLVKEIDEYSYPDACA